MLKRLIKYGSISFIILCFSANIKAQQDSISNLKRAQRNLIISETAIGLGVQTGLYFEWYSNYPMNKFHFFDDSKEWQLMDKFGHFYSAYYLTAVGHQAGKMAGFNNKQAALNGLIMGLGFQTLIEVLDGFSENWGASVADLTANTLGGFFAYTQARVWDEQKITMKWSFSPTRYAPIRPNVLGNGVFQEFLKDYNGQTYWLSGNINSLTGIENKYIPNWLNIELGYGGRGMLGGYENNWFDNEGNFYDFSHEPRYKQFYLSAGVDWMKLLKPKNEWGKLTCTALNAIKFPFPAVSYSTLNNSFQGHWIKF